MTAIDEFRNLCDTLTTATAPQALIYHSIPEQKVPLASDTDSIMSPCRLIYIDAARHCQTSERQLSLIQFNAHTNFITQELIASGFKSIRKKQWRAILSEARNN